MRIRNGDLTFLDKLAKSNYQVIGLDLEARNLGLGSQMDLTVKAPLKGSSPTMTFEGPITAEAQLKPLLSGNSVKSVSGRVDFDATKLRVEMKGGIFHKTESMPLRLQAQFEGSEKETLLRGLDLQFADIKVHGKGRVTMEPLAAKVDIATDPGTVRLDKVQAFVPMAEAYQLKGSGELNLGVDWKPDNLRVNGDLKVSEGGFYLKDVLKAPMQFRIQLGFSENSLNLTRFALSGPETELELTGNVRNFLAPQFTFALTGKSFNVDKAIVLPAPAAAKSAGLLPLLPEAYAAAPVADGNPLLALSSNPMVAGAGGTVTAQIGRITVYNAALDQISVKAQLQHMLLKIVEASLKTFGGSIRTSGEFELKSPGLSYHSQGSLAGISAKEAFKTYFPKYASTLEGTVDSSWNVSGAAFPALLRMRNVKGTAKLVAKDGSVKSVDFQESINAAMSKVPFLKNQKPIKMDNGFKIFSTDVKLEGGVVRADPIEIQPRGQGFVIKGKSTIQESLEQETLLDVYDPQGQLPKELQNPGKPALALRIYGPLTGPRTDYEYTVKRLVSGAGTKIVKEQGLKAIGKALGMENKEGQSDQDKLKEAADKLRKKFHF
jgi:hypothetical protein